MPNTAVSHNGGRPMKPIPDDAPPERAQLAQALRDLVDESIPEGVPTVAIAELAGIGKSTLFHALSGQRLPNLDTLLTVVNACAVLRTTPDGSTPANETKGQAIDSDTRESWKALWEQAQNPQGSVRLLAGPGTGTSRLLLDEELESADVIAYGGHGHTANGEQASVAEAQEELHRAVRKLEDAARSVAQAEAKLRLARLRERDTHLEDFLERLRHAGVDSNLLGRAYAESKRRLARLRDQEPPAHTGGEEEAAR
ncbi:hypothetical protein [Streptomyces lanatus]|uniref:HTH cro/C1-type domain-containing protein n=1 Tax=Streptomyces lanatus TaxID=66900 RepID=A0ABV1Y819_9ACTN|nr:hypothetical protein [Streptomyces lanatus]GHH31705.1 hypothetical protein GCM10018780_92970 [Streptomyces lanatus]